MKKIIKYFFITTLILLNLFANNEVFAEKKSSELNFIEDEAKILKTSQIKEIEMKSKKLYQKNIAKVSLVTLDAGDSSSLNLIIDEKYNEIFEDEILVVLVAVDENLGKFVIKTNNSQMLLNINPDEIIKDSDGRKYSVEKRIDLKIKNFYLLVLNETEIYYTQKVEKANEESRKNLKISMSVIIILGCIFFLIML